MTLLKFNGVSAETGGYLFSPMPSKEVVRLAMADRLEVHHRQDLWRRSTSGQSQLGPKEGVDPCDLSQAGWGVVLAQESPPEILEALQPLLDLRRDQATAGDRDRLRILSNGDGYHPEETKPEFLARHGVGPGPADPDRVPYYLLLVGGPDQIPYQFQYQLGVQYAVGRLAFATPEDYRRYAESVVFAETTRPALLPHRASFFAVRNAGDEPTALSHDHLVRPLAASFENRNGWEVEFVGDGRATKAALLARLGGEETPAVLFTASHGVGFDPGHPLQRDRQGAILCQDWPGPESRQPVPRSQYVAADDIPDDARLQGLISFHFACYSAGTPQQNDFPHLDDERPIEAPEPFVARLPQRLLSLGALAVVGHVERAWSYSFDWPGAGRQAEVFASTLRRLLSGHPVGSAMEFFTLRRAELATDLEELRGRSSYGAFTDAETVSAIWTAGNDARNYLILGDPAVRALGSD